MFLCFACLENGNIDAFPLLIVRARTACHFSAMHMQFSDYFWENQAMSEEWIRNNFAVTKLTGMTMELEEFISVTTDVAGTEVHGGATK